MVSGVLSQVNLVQLCEIHRLVVIPTASVKPKVLVQVSAL